MGNPRTLQVVGFRKCGKTTLMNSLVRLATEEGAKVVTIKHHGHPSPLILPDKDTDSMQHFRAGADASIVYGNGVMQMHERCEEDGALSHMYEEAVKRNPDYILIEGFKQASFPKIVLWRQEEDKQKLMALPQIYMMKEAGLVHEKEEVKRWWEEWIRDMK
ncbi:MULTISPECIES: molybdopterin-guanine dinucleotide biosynthesis protein B [Salimicrobium]|uniref:Molybdopterin-guanine dinucleotide biosynthesis protein B n=2 Tax=Salimicrobium TaxID=351195 RepID=A0ABY1KXF8_9BACI|nr:MULTISPECIES: molybdopterin-guanine dinucleotide biosynthesis protein B [Salimicrobium]SDX86897.1 molybdopterin-guanine dinucleotide biosynthesis protein B [Salimicrobium album]SIS88455.1 molybdopterin-guanine dinucleotide biosynthesis protein B [Salimicrobium salexigens]